MPTKASAGNRRRVLIVVQNLPVPFDRRVWLEATTLARAGWSVSVICPKAEQFPRSFEELEDVHIYRYALPFEAHGALGFVAEFAWCFLRTAMKTARVAARGRGFDVLHVCNPPETYWPLGWLCQRFGVRFVFDHHDLSPEMYAVKFGDRSRLTLASLRFLERMTFRVADIVITTNESHRRIAVQRGRKAPADVFVVRSGPDLLRLRRTEPDLSLRRGGAHLLVYLGEICEQDGVDHLVRAMQILRDELGRTDVRCVFVGGGPHQPAVKEYAHTIGVSEMCTFTGRVSDEDLSVILSTADIGVDPDPKNDWSDKSTMNKVMEYMFFGLPVVAYDLAETRVSADGAAVYAEPNSERSLAAEIDTLLDDPERRRRMGAAGHDRVRTTLAWEYSAPVLLEAYERLVPSAPRPSHV